MSITFLLAEEVTAAIQEAIDKIPTTPGTGLTTAQVQALIDDSLNHLMEDFISDMARRISACENLIVSQYGKLGASIDTLAANIGAMQERLKVIIPQYDEKFNSLGTDIAACITRLQSDEDRILASESKYNQVSDSLTGLVNNLESFKSTVNASLADKVTASVVNTLIANALAVYDPDTYATLVASGESPNVDVVWVRTTVAGQIINPSSNLTLKFQTFIQDGESFDLQATANQTIRGGKITVAKNTNANIPFIVRLMRNPTQLTQWVRA